LYVILYKSYQLIDYFNNTIHILTLDITW